MIDRFKGSRSDYWNTPTDIYNKLIQDGYVDYNPNTSYIDPFYANVDKYHSKNIFINPPFSILNKKEWLISISKLIENGNHIKLLLPARTDTKQFHALLDLGFQVTFIKGRLRYNDGGPAPFPSLWMTYRQKI